MLCKHRILGQKIGQDEREIRPDAPKAITAHTTKSERLIPQTLNPSPIYKIRLQLIKIAKSSQRNYDRRYGIKAQNVSKQRKCCHLPLIAEQRATNETDK